MHSSRVAARIVLAGLAIATLVAVLTPRIYDAENAVQTSLTVALFILSLACYLIGYSVIARSSRDLTPAVLVAGAFVIAGGFTLWPFVGADVWTYVSFGWMQTQYRLSPYGAAIANLPGFGRDPMLAATSAGEYFPYGPVLAGAVKLACLISGANPSHAVLVFKVADVILEIAIAAMVASIAVGLGTGRRDAVLYLFLCQPIIAIEFPGEGHNDLLVVAPLVLAILLAERNWLMLVLPAIAIGAMVKFIPAIAAPFAFIYVARHRGIRTAIISTALAGAICVIFAAPYLTGWTSPIMRLTVLAQFQTYQTPTAAIGYIVVTMLRMVSANAVRDRIHVYEGVAALAMIAYAAFFVAQLVTFARKPSLQLEDLIEVITLLVIVFICLARNKYEGYYVALFMPTALMLDRQHWLSRAAIALGFTGLLEMGLNYKVPITSFALLTGIPLAWAWLTRNIEPPAHRIEVAARPRDP
jgi:hypothetical protein